VRVETVDGRERLVLTRWTASTNHRVCFLREQVTAVLPRIDLPGVLLDDVDWTGFLPSSLTSVSVATCTLPRDVTGQHHGLEGVDRR